MPLGMPPPPAWGAFDGGGAGGAGVGAAGVGSGVADCARATPVARVRSSATSGAANLSCRIRRLRGAEGRPAFLTERGVRLVRRAALGTSDPRGGLGGVRSSRFGLFSRALDEPLLGEVRAR